MGFFFPRARHLFRKGKTQKYSHESISWVRRTFIKPNFSPETFAISPFSKSFSPDPRNLFNKQFPDLPEKSLRVDPNGAFGHFTCESNPPAELVSILGAGNYIVTACAIAQDDSEWADSLDFLSSGSGF